MKPTTTLLLLLPKKSQHNRRCCCSCMRFNVTRQRFDLKGSHYDYFFAANKKTQQQQQQLRFFHPKRAHIKRVSHRQHQQHQHQHYYYPEEEVFKSKHIPNRAAWLRFLDPWYDLAECTSGPVLIDKVDSVTRTFGVVGALMTSLSAALLAVSPAVVEEEEEEVITNEANIIGKLQQNDGIHESSSSSSEISMDHEFENAATDRPSRTTDDDHNSKDETPMMIRMIPNRRSSLLMVYGGIPRHQLHDWYTACCAGAFYGGVCATGISAVLNAWLAATPMHATKQFVQHHSKLLVCIPGFLGVSTLLAGTALFLGLDFNNGTPISFIGLGGTVLSGSVIGSAAIRGWFSTYRTLTKLVRR